jgi:hypothetical protein
VNSAKELKELLDRVKRTRGWLAEQTGYSLGSVRQYLGGSKQSRPFFKKAAEVLKAEEAHLKAGRKMPPQWILMFETEEEFQRVDRASRAVHAESFADFCRQTLLARADEILARKKLGTYPKPAPVKGLKVAEGDG